MAEDGLSSGRGPDGFSRRGFMGAGAAFSAWLIANEVRVAEGASQPQSPLSLPGEEAPGLGGNDGAITKSTVREAEKLAGLRYTDAERAMIVESIGGAERFNDRRAHQIPNGVGPATVFRVSADAPTADGPVIPGIADPGPLPASEEDIAFAPVTSLSVWVRDRELTSTRLTRIYLERIKRLDPKLECIVTLTETLALEQATQADREIAAGNYRGPLHGLPYGLKDLFDTEQIRTSFGAMPYKDRVPQSDSTVYRKLTEAGAVLIAKTTLGALAYGDIWFDGRTNNPFNLDEGSSGSSAGSASGTAAGLFAFSIGTETLGSIVSPSMRCGTTGLRPTFGRVGRGNAMALCWSLDKVGPICRGVEDTALVLSALNGHDPLDASSVASGFTYDGTRSVRGMRVGYSPAWFAEGAADDIDRKAFEELRQVGVELVEIELPDLPYGALYTQLIGEAAAAFEEITLTNSDDTMKWQEPQAWPNSFRTAWFTPMIELIQADRIRRQIVVEMDRIFGDEENGLDCLFGPSFAGPMLLITNYTGHPQLCLRAGFRDNGTPKGVSVWGRLYGEEKVCRLGAALERRLGVASRRPDLS
ncbi:MAG: amidase [Planctomycetota bacterium]